MNKKRVLFVCIGNTCRSQMAEAFARRFAEKDIEIYSAGSRPCGFIFEEVSHAMKEKGYEMTGQYSKGIDELPYKEFDIVVSLCGDRCPVVAAKKRIEWDIADPIGRPKPVLEGVRDEIEKRVKKLFNSL